MREREEGRVAEETFPVWSLLHSGNKDFVNHLYRGQQSQVGGASSMVGGATSAVGWAINCTCMVLLRAGLSARSRCSDR